MIIMLLYRCISDVMTIFLFVYWLRTYSMAEESPITKIQNGTLEGTFMRSRRGRQFAAFRGIPYAQPPVDQLRFEPPKVCNSWNGVRLANEDANVCIQRDIFSDGEKIFGFEDCLYLNVYTPKVPENKMNPAHIYYPVMIWFHGGGWVAGSSHSSFYGPKFFLDDEIVLVTVNYRLGPMGFLSTEDLVIPGNQGMKDQAQSIRWVHENIVAFSGDPNSVTIFGESAGGASVHYHMLSPLTRGLFHRGISQSGTVYSPWTLSQPDAAINNTKRLGKSLNCPIQDSRSLIECLRKKKSVDIVSSVPSFRVFDAFPVLPFRPVIESDHPGAYIKKEPAQSIKSGDVADIPWMTGIVTHEGTVRVAGIYGQKDEEYDKLLNKEFMTLGPAALLYDETCHHILKDDITQKIREFYFGDKNIDAASRMNLVDLFTDAWFYIAADKAVRDHLEALSSPIYYYHFTYKGNTSFSALFGDSERDYGISHCDELQYLFPVGELLFPDTSLSTSDHKMVDLMTRLWVNFAKLGNPTPEKNAEIQIKWKPVRTSRLEYLHIRGPNGIEMSSDLFPDRVNFWASLPYRSKIESGNKEYRTKDEL